MRDIVRLLRAGLENLLGLALLIAVGVSVVGGPRLVRAAVAQRAPPGGRRPRRDRGAVRLAPA